MRWYLLLGVAVGLIAYILFGGGGAKAEYFIANNPGGHIVDFQKELANIEQSGERVRVEGECDSACTMVLKLSPNRVCVGPWAKFGFHTAYGVRKKDGRHIFSPVGTQLLLNTYPPSILEWIKDHGGLHEQLIYLEGEDLHRLLPACPTVADPFAREAFKEARLAVVDITMSALQKRGLPTPLPPKRPVIWHKGIGLHGLY